MTMRPLGSRKTFRPCAGIDLPVEHIRQSRLDVRQSRLDSGRYKAVSAGCKAVKAGFWHV